MPLYEYQCSKCAHRFERIEKVSGPHAKRCPKCGGKIERLVAPPAIQFKGSGWYVTDYARQSTSAGDSPGAEAHGDQTAKEGKPEKEAAKPGAVKETKKGKKDT